MTQTKPLTLTPEIRRSRTAQVTVTVLQNGQPLADRDVVVEQTRHAFLFGANWGSRSAALASGELSGREKELAEQRNAFYLDLFNLVTLPFYWGGFEPQRGKPLTERILKLARWYQENGCRVKGHPLCWHTVTANWLLDLTNDEIRDVQIARIQREVADFAGVIDMWDVVNEAVIMPVFDKYDNGITRICKEMGRVNLIRTMFETARAVNPGAVLLLNDFDTSTAYDVLIESCLDAGVQIDVIGIQSHMHQGYWGLEKLQRVLALFERFNLPIHFTETTIISGDIMPKHITDLNDWKVEKWDSTPEGEARQAEEVSEFYKALVAHPLLQAISWWDFTDGAWLNAPAGLLRIDETPKPAYDELHKLIKGEWWLSPTTFRTDANGQFTLEGFLGDYALSVGDSSAVFALTQTGAGALTVTV